MVAISPLFLLALLPLAVGHEVENSRPYPFVVSTWPFVEAVKAAWTAANSGFSAVDAVVEGCAACEELRCDGTVGPGGSPDENGESTMDALVMNGVTMEVGAVAAMRFVRDGIRAARLVMQHTEHTMLVGDQASAFAISMGLPGPSNLSSPESLDKWIKWKENRCQPNFRKNVLPTNNCGPYHRKDHVDFGENVCLMNNLVENCRSISPHVGLHNHDTISMAVVDRMGHIAVGTSTNGASFKIPGRVGDGPIAGSSAYADDEVGACGATGDGDIMMRFLPCYQVVESMRLGMEPRLAAKDAISRIARKYPDFVGAIFAVNKNGVHAGACHGWTFQYSVRSPEMKDVEIFRFFRPNIFMEREGDCLVPDTAPPNGELDIEESVLSSNFVLDHVGEVVLTLNSDGLSWKWVESMYNEEDGSSCLGIQLVSKKETTIRYSEAYAVEFIDWGLVHESVLANASGCLLGHASEMYRFTVHCVLRSNTHPCLWAPSVYTFGHKDLVTCQMWVARITAFLNMEAGRPKNLLVFVHPRSGKGNGCRTWEAVAPIFYQAKVQTKVTVTHRAGQAFDVMASISNRELNSYDGVVAVGGDGFFNEILNGLLLSRHKAPYPPSPTDFSHSVDNDDNTLVQNTDVNGVEPSDQNEDHSPLLSSSKLIGSQITNHRTEDGIGTADQEADFSLPNERFRFGLIPAGSTDAIVMCTTGARDPITSALHIVLGKRVSLDIAQIVRWKTTLTSKEELSVRYAASFAGYGFYGDVITESERYRWMGPKRYDYAGTKVFLRHSSYEAEVAYVEVKPDNTILAPENGVHGAGTKSFWGLPKKSKRVACRVKCDVCNTKTVHMSTKLPDKAPHSQESKWLRSKGRFLSVGAAVISCRNEKAPDGLVADAHLSDGFLHLILIKDCPRALYLWHLTQLARKGGNPLNFEFVEHHKTSAFTFTSFGKESTWNVDGEIFRAHQLSAQVFRGLVSVFAAGPEV